MAPRIAALVLLVLLVLIHKQMWLGQGSVPGVAAKQEQLRSLKQANAQARQVNEQLSSEVEDLQTGLGLVEEKARMELGMVKPNEIYVQILP